VLSVVGVNIESSNMDSPLGFELGVVSKIIFHLNFLEFIVHLLLVESFQFLKFSSLISIFFCINCVLNFSLSLLVLSSHFGVELGHFVVMLSSDGITVLKDSCSSLNHSAGCLLTEPGSLGLALL
jgi:hypothetical protein